MSREPGSYFNAEQSLTLYMRHVSLLCILEELISVKHTNLSNKVLDSALFKYTPQKCGKMIIHGHLFNKLHTKLFIALFVTTQFWTHRSFMMKPKNV